MTFLTACVTNHVGQIAALLLSRSISIACVHNGATFPVVLLNMTRFATVVTSSLITTGCYSIAGFTRSIITAARRIRSLRSVQRQLCGIPFYFFCDLPGTPDSPVLRMCIPGRQLLLYLGAHDFAKSVKELCDCLQLGASDLHVEQVYAVHQVGC